MAQPEDLIVPAESEILRQARSGIRLVERYCYRLLSEASDADEELPQDAKDLLRMAKGLRRKLDLRRI